MRHVGLRDWLEAVESRGELEYISGASWDLEMGSIAELVFREGKEPKPALLFDQIPGYPEGYRTLFGMIASPWRIARTLGLPEDEIEHVFDKFYRVGANEKHAKGTGLGLNLVKQIIEKVHNGRVFVASQAGVGSTFGFELPLARKEAISTS